MRTALKHLFPIPYRVYFMKINDLYTLKGIKMALDSFVKEKRKASSLTQPELAEKAGVGLRFVRELEQGKETLRLDKVNKVLQLSQVLFPFFDGLIPEGWLLDIAERNWKLNPRDRMGLLLACCKDCIGAVSVYPVNEEEESV